MMACGVNFFLTFPIGSIECEHESSDTVWMVMNRHQDVGFWWARIGRGA